MLSESPLLPLLTESLDAWPRKAARKGWGKGKDAPVSDTNFGTQKSGWLLNPHRSGWMQSSADIRD
jgi:hypothetical protein